MVKGHIFAPKSSEKIPAEINLLQEPQASVSVVSHGYRGDFCLADIQVSQQLSSIPRRLTFPDGWVFVPQESHILNSWLNQQGKTSLLAKLEQHLLLIILAVVVTAISAFAGYKYGLPLLAKSIAQNLPVQVAEYVGDNTVSMLDELGMEESKLSIEAQKQIANEFEQITDELKGAGIEFITPPKLLFKFHQGDANAFALANGNIIMTDAMANLASTPEERKAVLLHELGHVRHQHVLTNLVQSAILSIGVAIIIGDSSSIGDTLVSVAVLGMGLSYSRELEQEADEFAAKQLLSSQDSVEPLLKLYQKLKQEQVINIPAWISTHPELSQRMKAIKQIQTQAEKQD